MNVNTLIQGLQALTEEERTYRVCIYGANDDWRHMYRHDVGTISVRHEDRVIEISAPVYVKMSLYRPE